MVSKFLDVLRDEVLMPRLDMLCEHGENYVFSHTDELSERMCWYNCVNRYKTITGLTQIDLAGDGAEQYKKFQAAIRNFCEGKGNVARAVKINPQYGMYWGLLRDALNIAAKGRAVIFGQPGSNILVTDENKYKYVNRALIAVICEKETLGKKWLAEMERRGWRNHFMLIITQGFSACEVIQTLMEIKEKIEKKETEFNVAVLHDNDIPGKMIYQDVHEWFSASDIGVNFEMLDRIDPALWDNLKEACKVDPKQIKMIENLGDQSLSFLDRIGNFRVELDNLYIQRGIGVFADYAEFVIARDMHVFDLNRVSTLDMYQPDALYALQRRIEKIWMLICKAAIGMESDSVKWADCAEKTREKMIEENRHFSIKEINEIRNFTKRIDAQQKVINTMIENDPKNKELIAKIAAVIEDMGITKLEQKIKENEKKDDHDADQGTGDQDKNDQETGDHDETGSQDTEDESENDDKNQDDSEDHDEEDDNQDDN